MMNKFVSLSLLLLLLLLAVASVTSFAPTHQAFVSKSCTTATALGMFGFGGGKKKPASDSGDKKKGKDLSVFGGRGSRITVREDEDNAMWIEGEDGGRESVYGKGKGK
jgi:hypothetical protein